MEEARRVLERLDRIEALDLAGAPADSLLEELRGLLGDAETWLAAERGANEPAAKALERCRGALTARDSAATRS